MTVFIGADHRGFALKDKIITYVQDKNIRIEDMGAYEYDAEDDFPDFASKVAKAVLAHPQDHLGIVICGSGAGISIAANKHQGIYCTLGLNSKQVEDSRRDDHINILAIAANYTAEEDAYVLVDSFLTSEKSMKEKYIRRLKKVDAITLPSRTHV